MIASSLRWPLYALVGLLVAAAIAFVAIRVVNQQIGISAEPVSAGEELSPAGVAKQRARRPHRHRHPAPTSTTTTVAPAPAPPSPAPAPAPAPSTGGEGDGGDD